MFRLTSRTLLVVLAVGSFLFVVQPSARAQTPPAPQNLPALKEWGDNFDGHQLDEVKWERFTFEGGSGGKLEVKEGQLRMRGVADSRAGVRSRETFTGDRYIVEAVISKVDPAFPRPGEGVPPPGKAILTILFDGTGRNRIEWLLSSDGIFEAWAVVDGNAERFDNRKMGTKLKNPTLSIARQGDEYFFALNGNVGLQKTIKNLPRSFRVMLYGFGTTQNMWDSVRVVTVK
jgi:hypothetical protein